MSTCLTACSSCQRHVRPEAEACPFCGAAAPAASARPRMTRRLSRPAQLAFGAAIGASVVMGCDGSTGSDSGTPPVDSGTVMTDSGTAMVDAGPGGDDAGFDAGELAMPYGAPPLREAWV